MRWFAALALAFSLVLAGCSGTGNIPVLEDAGGGPAPVPAGCADVTEDVIATLGAGISSLTLLTSPQGLDALRQGEFSFDVGAYRAALAVTRFVEVTGLEDEEAGDAITGLDDAAERAGVLIASGTPSHEDLVAFTEATGGPGQLLEDHQRVGAAGTATCGASLG